MTKTARESTAEADAKADETLDETNKAQASERPDASDKGAKSGKGKDGKSASSKSSKSDSTEDGDSWSRWKANLRTLGGAVALALFIRIVLFEPFEIEGPSMEPTLFNGDRVVVAKCLYGLFLPFTHEAVLSWGMPNPGDIVIVKSPQDDIDIVKRVIGLPGDLIEVREDVVYKNGHALPTSDAGPCTPESEMQSIADCEWVSETVGSVRHRTSHSLTSPPSEMPPVRVPPGHIFILGDHRDRSNDSRFFGTVPIGRVKGRALAIYWSNGRDGIRTDRLFTRVN